jgi:hypothetical protein
MMDLLLISILGPFGGNQLITALNAPYSEAGTTIEYCHVTCLVFRFQVARKKPNEIAAKGGFLLRGSLWIAVDFCDLARRKRSFLRQL